MPPCWRPLPPRCKQPNQARPVSPRSSSTLRKRANSSARSLRYLRFSPPHPPTSFLTRPSALPLLCPLSSLWDRTVLASASRMHALRSRTVSAGAAPHPMARAHPLKPTPPALSPAIPMHLFHVHSTLPLSSPIHSSYPPPQASLPHSTFKPAKALVRQCFCRPSNPSETALHRLFSAHS